MTAPQYEGRLELTWTNKHRRLLSHEDGSYEWTDPGDHRVAEVRLLHDVTSVGDTRGKRDRAKDNLLIRGDALHGLTSLTKLPEFRDEYVGRVKLCYIDPPFNTGQAFAQYDDALDHSVWLTMMRDRLVQVHELLSPDGSVWVHLDDAEVHRARLVLDEVFGLDNFVATFIWERTDIPAMQAGVSIRHDYIHVYRKSAAFMPNGLPSEGEVPPHYDKRDADNLPYCLRTLRMTGAGSQREDRPTMWYPVVAPDGTEVWPIRTDGTEGRWRWGPERYEREAESLEWVNRDGSWEPYRRIYFDGATTRPPETILSYTEFGSNRVAKLEQRALFPGVTPFATPKPERLLWHVIRTATAPGDLVLDCFAGSGTTAAVAQKMQRRWATVEWSRETIERFTLPRLTKVVGAEDSGGVTADTSWDGGGGFRVLDVAPSMFAVQESRVVLADWAINGALGEAVAAQVGFAHAPDPPFTGVKGRTRLAVVDGLVDEAVVTMLAGWLPDGELMTVYGTAVDPVSKEALRSMRRGCTVRKIPQSVLDEYRRRGRSDGLNWPSQVASSGEAAPAVPAATVTA